MIIKLSQLWSPAWKIAETDADISAGRLSRTKAPLRVSRMGRGRYFIMDGNHRAMEAIMAGAKEYPAVFDQYIPDLTKTGGAYRNEIESAVNVADGIIRRANPRAIRSLPLAAANGMKVLKGFRPAKQSTPYTCGPACARAVLVYKGFAGVTEPQLAREAGTTARHGTTPTQLCNVLAKNGARIIPTKRACLAWCLRQLRQSRPVLLLWNDWKGHWVVLIGYDARRRLLLLADPAAAAGIAVHTYDTFTRNWRTQVKGQVYRRLAVAIA